MDTDTSPGILTLNAGSSSLKVGVFTRTLVSLAHAHVDRIGDAAGMTLRDGAGRSISAPDFGPDALGDHAQALSAVLAALEGHFPSMEIAAVGHRVVHGGPDFADPLAIDDAVLRRLEDFVPFAPLHQPHNLAGIRAAQSAFPGAVQVACFDTAFHRHHPFVNDTFALPRAFYERGVRRYGFHGLSYQSVSAQLARIAPGLASGRVVIAHLGNGASMCALEDGRSVASTMGFTALDGLPMGTRCGQVDPGVILYLLEQEGMSAPEVSDLLYRRSGLLGLSGISHDMRTLEASDAPEARQAIDYFVFRIKRELGGLSAALGGLDALVFCGGIGENSRLIRARVAEGMGWLGVAVDDARNAANGPVISPRDAGVTVMVVPTDEEAVIARDTGALADGIGAWTE
jgi:acetate kinase